MLEDLQKKSTTEDIQKIKTVEGLQKRNLVEAVERKNVFERSSKLFFFCFLNESWALTTAKQVAADVVDHSYKNLSESEAEVAQLKKINKLYLQNLKKKNHQGTTPVLGHFEIPKTLDLGAWREFRRSTSPEDFYITCLFYIGQYSPDCISQVLKLSPGTIKLRLSRGVKKLGSLLLKEYLY